MLTPLPDHQLVLDFVNTRTRDEDLLSTRALTADWVAARTGAEAPPEFSGRDVAKLKELRALLGELFDFLTPTTVRRVDALLADLRLVPRLGDHATVALMLDVTDRSPVAAVSQLVVASLLSLAQGPGLATVRSCAAPDCLIRFSSTNPRRQWCNSGGCGNRERVRRHYRRRHAS